MQPSSEAIVNPNQLSPRSAMGLSGSLIDRLGPDALNSNVDLLQHDTISLIEALESVSESVERRFAAGTLLAFRGDPRIQPLTPQMIKLPGARVTLGSDDTDVERVVARWRHTGVVPEWIRKECPRYEADVEPFAIARFPVTNMEFHLFLKETGYEMLPHSWILGTYPVHLANHPVWTITPEAADAYADWLAHRTGRSFRLPTEAEWEYAASSGESREFPWGHAFDPECANTVESGPLCTTPVGMYPRGRTASGIDDMAGNVEEYTSNNYAPYEGGDIIEDDLLRTQGAYRVARGGSFARYGDLARCQRRHGWFYGPIYAMGMRLAETI
jgi:formylglycine-generating enzyme required for sulfatase activity